MTEDEGEDKPLFLVDVSFFCFLFSILCFFLKMDLSVYLVQ
jgi:hypothetical protein